jgi:putative pyruvate formate lyase activating enzyme
MTDGGGSDLLGSCALCPRGCGCDRRAGEVGACRIAADPLISSAFAHLGEEACLSGTRGSGTIFFAGCNLHCVFCQNGDLSQRAEGMAVDANRLAGLMLDLQDRGCHNVNLVSPTHVAGTLVDVLDRARARGLRVPVVYNSGGYESVATLRRLAGRVDVYMPDVKFWSAESGRRYCGVPDYPERARAALREMHAQVGDLVLDEQGLAVRGLLVRHLVMPGLGDETAAILGWLSRELSPATYVNLLAQYRPEHLVGSRDAEGRVRYPELDRRPTRQELAAAAAAARAAGLDRLEGVGR